MLNFGNKRYFGLDIGESAIKLMEVKKTHDGYHLVKGHLVELNIDPTLDDTEKRNSIIKAKLKNLFADEQIKSGVVALSVPSQSVFIRFLKIPKIAKNKIEQIIQYEAQLQVPFPINEVIWSYGVFEAYDSPETDVILVAVKRDIVEDNLKLLANTSLEPDFVEVSYFSIFNAVDFLGDVKDKLILDVGAKNTNIIIIEEHKMWTRSILIGGNDLTKAIASHLKITFNEAEQMKRREGIIAMTPEERTGSTYAAEISDAINPVLVEILADISKSIGYYKSQFGETKVLKEVLLTGGASKIKNMDRFIHENLDIPTRPMNIFENIKSDVDFNLTEDFMRRMDASIGLALKTIMPLHTTTNLLPKEIIKSKEFEKKRWYIFGSLIVLICIFATLANFAMWSNQKKSKGLSKTSALINRYTSFSRQIEGLQAEIGGLKSQLEFIKSVSAKREEGIKYLTEMVNLLPSNLWLTEIIQDGADLTINGKTKETFENINTFKEMLTKSGYFTAVRVESANVLKDNESTEDIRAFTIKMKMVTQ
ncbi:MAG: type IV pilus assembly protein PilM [Candidatus Omnitrophica bacterium]|nr:type IV pilus assembly protein PilM [Candidatus Omnitrophota bacterium]